MLRKNPLQSQFKVLFRKLLYVHECPDGKIGQVILIHYELLPAPPILQMYIKDEHGVRWRVHDITWEQNEQAYVVETQESTNYTNLTNFIKMMEEQGWYCLTQLKPQPHSLKEIKPYRI